MSKLHRDRKVIVFLRLPAADLFKAKSLFDMNGHSVKVEMLPSQRPGLPQASQDDRP